MSNNEESVVVFAFPGLVVSRFMVPSKMAREAGTLLFGGIRKAAQEIGVFEVFLECKREGPLAEIEFREERGPARRGELLDRGPSNHVAFGIAVDGSKASAVTIRLKRPPKDD